MPHTANASNRAAEDTRRTVANGLIALALAVFLLIAFGDTGIRAKSFIPLEELNATSDVTYVTGETAHFNTSDFGYLHKGDRAEVHITLPEITRGTEAYVPLFNAVVNMSLDDEPLFRDEYDPDNLAAHYGNRIYEAALPEGSDGHVLTVEIIANQSMGYSELRETGLVQANEAWKLILQDRASIFVVFLSLISAAIFGGLYCIVQSIVQRRMLIGVPIALFELVFVAWFFGTNHMFHLLFGNVEFCAKVEYYALYLIPLPLALFIQSAVDSPAFKRAVRVSFVVYLVFYLIATAIELSPLQLNYSDMISYMHPIAGAMFLLLATALFAGVKQDRDGNIFILRYGAIFAVICGIVELVRYSIIKQTEWGALFTFNGLSIFAILAIMSFTVAVVLYLVASMRAEFASRIERAQLAELAYTDILTNMLNRAGLRHHVDQMKEEGVRDYTMVFIDLNDLKVANDRFGHDMGDKLLVRLADIVKSVFAANGFCARWGGDEFVACVFGDEATGEKLISSFKGEISALNEQGEFPFEVSVACGHTTSSAANYLDPVEAIHIADKFMYENKRAFKDPGDVPAAEAGVLMID